MDISEIRQCIGSASTLPTIENNGEILRLMDELAKHVAALEAKNANEHLPYMLRD